MPRSKKQKKSAINQPRAPRLDQFIDQMERKVRVSNRIDSQLLARLFARQQSLEPVGPLAGKRVE